MATLARSEVVSTVSDVSPAQGQAQGERREGEAAPPPRRPLLPIWARDIRFVGFHLLCGLTYFVGVSWGAIALCVGLYYFRMFAITAGYHRYFAHRTFKTSRAFQLVLAFLGSTSLQKGVLWWSSHHRHHHRHSDQEEDVHSPTRRGFLWAHMGWILSPDYETADYGRIADFARYPELRWLDANYIVTWVFMCAVLFLAGGLRALVWGGVVSTVILWHGTFTINSLAHVFGRRVYETTDTSRNSLILALITMGEGWHNNHHYYQASANQGFRWWEVDLTFYILVLLEKLGIIWDLKRAPAEVVAGNLAGKVRLVEAA